MKSKTKIEKQTKKKRNPELVETILAAKKTGKSGWMKVASILSGSRRNRPSLNWKEIEEKATNKDDNK